MRRSLFFVVTFVASLTAPAVVGAQQDFAAAKELYIEAKYEDALTVLDRLKEAPSLPDAALGVEQYRAMCLLALSRKAEAEKAIEAIADLDPFYQPAEDDAAPWVRAAFREARRKVLPAALQRLYGHAKQAYNNKDMQEAVIAFGRVLKILDDPDLALDKAAQADMKMVAQGFLDLAQAAATPPPAPQQPSQPVAQAPSPSSMPASASSSPRGSSSGNQPAEAPPAANSAAADTPALYDMASPGVTPPLPVRRDVPSASGPRAPAGAAVVLEVVVRESGTIESAVVRQSAGKYYDELIAQAARNWLYRPATKEGRPVRYRLLVKVVVGREEPGEPMEAGSAAKH